MTVRQLTISLPGEAPAILTVPQALTPESLRELEQGFAGTLARLRREMGSDAADPGALEYASWMQHLCPSRP